MYGKVLCGQECFGAAGQAWRGKARQGAAGFGAVSSGMAGKVWTGTERSSPEGLGKVWYGTAGMANIPKIKRR